MGISWSGLLAESVDDCHYIYKYIINKILT